MLNLVCSLVNLAWLWGTNNKRNLSSSHPQPIMSSWDSKAVTFITTATTDDTTSKCKCKKCMAISIALKIWLTMTLLKLFGANCFWTLVFLKRFLLVFKQFTVLLLESFHIRENLFLISLWHYLLLGFRDHCSMHYGEVEKNSWKWSTLEGYFSAIFCRKYA